MAYTTSTLTSDRGLVAFQVPDGHNVLDPSGVVPLALSNRCYIIRQGEVLWWHPVNVTRRVPREFRS